MADPHRAEGPGRVVDQVGQRLRDRRTRDGVEERVHLVRGPAGVERAPDRRRREAVDGRLPAGLDVGQQVQVACALAGRADPGRRPSGRPGSAPRRPPGAAAASADQSGRRRPAERRRTTRGRRAPPARAWAASSSAATTWSVRDGGRRGRCQATCATSEAGPVPVASTWPEGSSARAVSVIVRVSGAIRLVSSGSRALRALPASSRVPTRNGSRSVSSHAVARRCQRSAAGRSHHPSNASVGVHDGVAVGVRPGRQQPGRGGDLDQQRRRRLVELHDVGRCLEVAHRHGPRAERDGRSGAPVVDEQLHPAYDVERRARGGSVHLVGGALGRRDLGRHVDPLPRRVAAPHGDLDLAGRAHESRPPGDEQSTRQQLLRRRRRLGRRDRLPGVPGVGLAPARLDVVEHRPSGRGQLRDAARAPRPAYAR